MTEPIDHPGLRIEVLDDPDAVGSRVADLIMDLVERTPTAVLGLATGSTPRPAYRELARRAESGAVSFAAVRGFLLDEYVGLDHDNPGSYHSTIRRELTDLVGIADGNMRGPDVHGDLMRSCDDYEAEIRSSGGIELQLLGIGRNGHVGFNEPGTPFDRTTYLAALTDDTRSDNARFFGQPDDVPTHALTQGPATILRARRIVMIATGPVKAAAIVAAVHGPISPSCPASLVRLHPHVILVLDRDAAAGLHGNGALVAPTLPAES